MGWTDVGSKVGRLIIDSSQPLLNQLHRSSPRSASPPQQQEEFGEPSCSNSGSGAEFQGPDTSSLSAFLYSFLSPSRRRESGEGGEWEIPEEFSDAQQELQEEEQLQEKGGEADWFVVSSEIDLDKSIMEDYVSSHSKAEVVTKLPPLSEDSCLLGERLRSVLYSSLPKFLHGRHWILLYSTARDGISLLTLYRKSSLLPGPCLLVVGDTKGTVFGGLLAAPLKPSRKRYQGTNQTFVFTNISGQPKVFPPTGMNRYYYLCTNNALAIGGGGHFALYLDSDLLTGSSGACETFGSCCLAHAEDFDLKEVELWGFEYSSKYVTRSSSFKG